MTAVSIRFNNPGALNTSSWVKAMPGYVSEQETTSGNHTARFSHPEQGVAAWWELLRRYRARHITTVGGIITEYGGGQDYSAYLGYVVKSSGLLRSTVVDLDDDLVLLKLAKAMFHYEAGQPFPMSDIQIRAGFKMGRNHAGIKAPVGGKIIPVPKTSTDRTLPLVVRLLLKLFRR
jgi:hypothetical protein